jgi:hypothetical protein
MRSPSVVRTEYARDQRQPEEYREPTSSEWTEFEEHFDKCKVELGSCGRPYGTPCAHEHACIRCPMLTLHPKMFPRLDELEADLVERRNHAAGNVGKGRSKASTSPSPSSAANGVRPNVRSASACPAYASTTNRWLRLPSLITQKRLPSGRQEPQSPRPRDRATGRRPGEARAAP